MLCSGPYRNNLISYESIAFGILTPCTDVMIHMCDTYKVSATLDTMHLTHHG
jgi:hypothetical protein